MTRHPLSILGAWLVTLSAFLFLLVFLLDLFGVHHNPYAGLVFFLILPVFSVVGLLMIPIGIVLERRRQAHGLQPHRWPHVDLNNSHHRRVMATVGALTLANLLIVSLGAYRGVEYMESTQFCGQVCHKVMEPEFVAHREGPHSRVACVDCHVGSGASSFIKSKVDGTRQLLALARGSYSRPIPTPVRDLRPARDTCERCHWPDKFHEDKMKVIPEFANDEKNTGSATRLLLHVGGGLPQYGLGAGIHWHTSRSIDIDFVATDDRRQDIPYVRLKDQDGTVHEYRTPDATDAQIAAGERRQMDCVDCHNRPTHAFFASPERAVDAALSRGAIPSSVPFVRREAVTALKAAYPDRATADRQIAERLRAFYRQTESALPAIEYGQLDQLVRTTQALYARGVFPEMKVSWGTHPDNLGHTDAPGCFRCHDDRHKTRNGRVIRQDCDLCHAIQ
jgi:NapC/NirT cytochrome c family, N-terminal region